MRGIRRPVDVEYHRSGRFMIPIPVCFVQKTTIPILRNACVRQVDDSIRTQLGLPYLVASLAGLLEETDVQLYLAGVVILGKVNVRRSSNPSVTQPHAPSPFLPLPWYTLSSASSWCCSTSATRVCADPTQSTRNPSYTQPFLWNHALKKTGGLL